MELIDEITMANFRYAIRMHIGFNFHVRITSIGYVAYIGDKKLDGIFPSELSALRHYYHKVSNA